MARSRGEAMGTDTGAASAAAPSGAERRRALTIALVAAVVLAALAAGAWWLATTLAAPRQDATQSAELTALDARLKAVRAAITPIASSFGTDTAKGTIDVGAYRARIAAAQKTVDDVNGLEVTDPEALTVRDLIVTGGSEVLTGLNLALDALVSDEASATAQADLQVEDGLQQLQEARDTLDRLLGRVSLTHLPSGKGTRTTTT